MSILFLGANRIPSLSKGSILGMTAAVYVILTVVPGFLIANSVVQEFTLIKLIALSCLIAFTMYAITSRLKNGNRTLWKPEIAK
jgi:hypothetical protein